MDTGPDGGISYEEIYRWSRLTDVSESDQALAIGIHPMDAGTDLVYDWVGRLAD